MRGKNFGDKTRRKKLNATNQVVERYLFQNYKQLNNVTMHTHTQMNEKNTYDVHIHTYTTTRPQMRPLHYVHISLEHVRYTHTNVSEDARIQRHVNRKKSCTQRCRIAFINDFRRRGKSRCVKMHAVENSSSSRMAVERGN